MELDQEIKKAICSNNASYFEENLGYKFDINYRLKEEYNDTLLHYALSDAGSNACMLLLRMQPDLTLLNDDGECLLHSVVYSGNCKRIMFLMQKANIDIDKRSRDGTTALLLAAILDKKEAFYYLVSIGANVNLADNDGLSPLHVVSQGDDIDMVKALLNNHANLFNKTNNGNLALAFAVNHGKKEIIECLYEAMGYSSL
jgi:ankyrin repeat protein